MWDSCVAGRRLYYTPILQTEWPPRYSWGLHLQEIWPENVQCLAIIWALAQLSDSACPVWFNSPNKSLSTCFLVLLGRRLPSKVRGRCLIQKKVLGMACVGFSEYIIQCPFEIETDYKHLIPILSLKIDNIPPCTLSEVGSLNTLLTTLLVGKSCILPAFSPLHYKWKQSHSFKA